MSPIFGRMISYICGEAKKAEEAEKAVKAVKKATKKVADKSLGPFIVVEKSLADDDDWWDGSD